VTSYINGGHVILEGHVSRVARGVRRTPPPLSTHTHAGYAAARSRGAVRGAMCGAMRRPWAAAGGGGHPSTDIASACEALRGNACGRCL